jgi:hypothetical protein
MPLAGLPFLAVGADARVPDICRAQPLLNHDQPQTPGSDRTPPDSDKINP